MCITRELKRLLKEHLDIICSLFRQDLRFDIADLLITLIIFLSKLVAQIFLLFLIKQIVVCHCGVFGFAH